MNLVLPREQRVAQLRNLIDTLRIADEIAQKGYLISSSELADLTDINASAVTSRGSFDGGSSLSTADRLNIDILRIDDQIAKDLDKRGFDRKGSNSGKGKGRFEVFEDFFEDVFNNEHDVFLKFKFFQKHIDFADATPTPPGDEPIMIQSDTGDTPQPLVESQGFVNIPSVGGFPEIELTDTAQLEPLNVEVVIRDGIVEEIRGEI